jgi:hypothetical protein
MMIHIISCWVMAPYCPVTNILEQHTASIFSVESYLKDGDSIKVKIALLQAVEAPRVVRGRGSHIT